MCQFFGDGIVIYREQAQGLPQETLIPFFPPLRKTVEEGLCRIFEINI